MRWTVLFLVCVATLVELLSWTVDRSSPAGIAIDGALSILSRSIAFSAVLVVVLRLSTSRVLKLVLCLAVILVLFSEFVTISGRPESWADVPVLGSHSAYHKLASRSLMLGGFVLFLSGLSLAVWEIHTAGMALERRSAEFAREAAEHVRALQELDDKTRRLSEAEETAQMGSWEWDERAEVLRCSDGLAPLFGLEPGKRELTYEELLAHIHPEDRDHVNRTILDAWDARGTLDYYHRAIDAHGEVHVLHSRGSVVVDENGVPARMVGTAQDITELKRVEEVLRQSEANFRVLAETTGAATFIHKGACFLYVNKAMSDLTGFSQAELLATNYWEVLAPESREMVRGRGQARLAGENPAPRYEIVVLTKSGEKRWCDLTVARVTFEGQTAALGAFFDITDRKRAEEVLAQERDLLKLIIDNVPDLIYVKEPDSRFIVGNVALLRLLGADKLDDIVGKIDFDFFPKELAARYYADEQSIVKTGQPLFNREEITVDPLGCEQILLTTKVPTCDANGNVVGIVGIGRDITDLKRAEDALRNRERFLADVFASIQDGISVLDTELRIVRVNLAMERWYADAMPLVGKKCFAAYHGRTKPCEVCPTLRAMETVQWASEVVPKRGPEGATTGWLDLYSFPLFDQDTGKLSGVIEYVRDITDQRRLENQLRHAQKLESLGVLAGGIAHDFNNLLVGMLGYAGLALTKLPAESAARGYVEKIEMSARRAAELTNQMLAYSGKGAFVVRPLNLSRLVEEVGRLLAASISKKAVLRYDCARDLPPIVGDAAQLHQVVMNLMTNASDALGDQPGVITLSTHTAHLDRGYLAGTYINDDLPGGLYVCLEVSDTGCGMDRTTLSRIFDPFFTTKFAGRGLGLAAVLGIVRGHKGAIKVYSEVGHGTRFRIVLPAEKVEKDAAQPQERPKDTGLDTWRGSGLVLVADDEETARAVAKEVLTEYGFSVNTAENGMEAVEMFRVHAQELVAVLLDLTMPIMSGQEAFEEMQKIRSEVPVVLSSGYTEQDVSQRFTGARPSAFIQKPYIHTDLLDKLRTVTEADQLA
jgi:PAS domain S-box-containing protein